MIITPPSFIPSTTVTTNIHQLSEAEAADLLQGKETDSFIRRLVFGYLIKNSIANNEAKHVKTGVKIVDLEGTRSLVAHEADTQHFAASINKLPVVLLILEDIRGGRLSMDQTLVWAASDVRGGAGVYDQPGAPLQAPLRDIIFDLLHRSGNTAVRILVNQGLGGPQIVNSRWAAEPKLSNTYLQPLDNNRFYLGNSTPNDSLWVLQKLMKKQDAPARFIKDALRNNIYDDMGVRSQLSGNDYITLANKVGILNDVEGNNRHDVGIIYNTKTHKSYAYAFFTTSPYDDPMATPQADQSLKDMGRYTLRYAGDKKQTLSAPRTLQIPEVNGRILY